MRIGTSQNREDGARSDSVPAQHSYKTLAKNPATGNPHNVNTTEPRAKGRTEHNTVEKIQARLKPDERTRSTIFRLMKR